MREINELLKKKKKKSLQETPTRRKLILGFCQRIHAPSESSIYFYVSWVRKKNRKERDRWMIHKKKEKKFPKTLTRHMLVFMFVKRSTLRQLLLLFSKFLFTKKKIEKQKEENERK